MPPEWKCLPSFVAIRLGLLLSSLLRSRWQLCCLTDAAHPLRVPLCLRFVTLPQFPSTTDLYKLAFACQGGIAALATVGTIENARISDRRKLVCTKTQYAERQRLIKAEASRMSTHPMAASEAMPPRRHFHCPARAASLTCKLAMRAFLLGDIKGAVLFREREPPPLPVQSRRRCFSPSALCREFPQKSTYFCKKDKKVSDTGREGGGEDRVSR